MNNENNNIGYGNLGSKLPTLRNIFFGIGLLLLGAKQMYTARNNETVPKGNRQTMSQPAQPDASISPESAGRVPDGSYARENFLYDLDQEIADNLVLIDNYGSSTDTINKAELLNTQNQLLIKLYNLSIARPELALRKLGQLKSVITKITDGQRSEDINKIGAGIDVYN